MENKTSKSGRIIAIIFVVIVVALGIFAFFVYTDRAGEIGERVKTFLPFGKGGDDRAGGPIIPPTPPGGGFIVGGENEEDKILRKLHDTPVAGLFSFLRAQPGRQTATSSPDVLVRYMERGLGHIYETNMTTAKETRISNETRLKVYEALWGNGGNNVAIRYLSDDENNLIRTYSITLKDIKNGTSTVEGKLVESEGVFLRENISDAVVSQGKGDRIFYILPVDDSSIGVTTSFSGEKQTQVFSSPLKEWLPQWPKESLITLTTKPSGSVSGIAFFLDSQSGKLTKILSGILGLTTNTNSDGNLILYAGSTRTGIALYVYNVAKDTDTRLSITTLPDKCVWSKINKAVAYCGVPSAIPSGEYPDVWYQGVVSFSDTMWMIDTESGITTILAKPQELSGEEVDATLLTLDPSESFLFFVNKKDSTPWSLKLTQLEEIL